MSEILNLAKAFEEKSKQQAQDTEQSVKREFARLETSISAELQSSSQSISNAIREQNGRLTGMLRASVSTAMAWIFLCFALLIGIMGGIIWFQGTIITSRLSEMDSYSQQLESLKAKSGAGVAIYSDDKHRNTYMVVLPKQAHGVETYTSTTDNTEIHGEITPSERPETTQRVFNTEDDQNHDRDGKTASERLRELTDKLRATAAGVAGQLQQLAAHVRGYLTGADAQRQGVSALEQSGGQLARAGRELKQERQPLDALIAQHDRARAEKLREQQPEPQKKPTRYYGPSM